MPNLKALSKKVLKGWRTLPESSPQRWFVMLAVIFGALFAVISPAYDVPDEYSHLSRAWQIGHGQLLAQKKSNDTGGYIPDSFKKVGDAVRANDFSANKILDLGNIPLNASQQTYHGFPNLVIYSPLVYAPQAIGLDAGDVLHLPAFYTMLLGRIFNLVAYVLLFYWAIRLLPFGKWVSVIVGLLPMHILLAGSLSADPMSIGLCALAVATMLYLRDKARPISRKTYVWLLVLVAALALTKLPFPLLIGLFVFLPISVLGGTAKRRWLLLGGMALTALIVGGGWLWLAKSTMVPYGPPGVDTAGQIHNLAHNPLGFIKTFVLTYFTPIGDSFVQAYVISVGPVLDWLPLWLTYAYTVFLVASVAGIRTASRAVFNRAQKQLLWVLGTVIFVLISVLLYVSWTPVGATVIQGMQARYFTPFIMLLIPLLATSARRQHVREGLLSVRWYRYVPLVFLFISVLAAFYYFYTMKIVVPF